MTTCYINIEIDEMHHTDPATGRVHVTAQGKVESNILQISHEEQISCIHHILEILKHPGLVMAVTAYVNAIQSGSFVEKVVYDDSSTEN